MKTPKVGTKFLYTFEDIFFIGEIIGSNIFIDIFSLSGNIMKGETYVFQNFFNKLNDGDFKLISEVNSIEHAIELYPELFI